MLQRVFRVSVPRSHNGFIITISFLKASIEFITSHSLRSLHTATPKTLGSFIRAYHHCLLPLLPLTLASAVAISYVLGDGIGHQDALQPSDELLIKYSDEDGDLVTLINETDLVREQKSTPPLHPTCIHSHRGPSRGPTIRVACTAPPPQCHREGRWPAASALYTLT